MSSEKIVIDEQTVCTMLRNQEAIDKDRSEVRQIAAILMGKIEPMFQDWGNTKKLRQHLVGKPNHVENKDLGTRWWFGLRGPAAVFSLVCTIQAEPEIDFWYEDGKMKAIPDMHAAAVRESLPGLVDWVLQVFPEINDALTPYFQKRA